MLRAWCWPMSYMQSVGCRRYPRVAELYTARVCTWRTHYACQGPFWKSNHDHRQDSRPESISCMILPKSDSMNYLGFELFVHLVFWQCNNLSVPHVPLSVSPMCAFQCKTLAIFCNGSSASLWSRNRAKPPGLKRRSISCRITCAEHLTMRCPHSWLLSGQAYGDKNCNQQSLNLQLKQHFVSNTHIILLPIDVYAKDHPIEATVTS